MKFWTYMPLVVLCVVAGACGSVSSQIRSVRRKSSVVATGGQLSAHRVVGSLLPQRVPDQDHDDGVVLDYGHEASKVDRRAVAVLVERYYTAGAANDGVSACSMLGSRFARSVPEDYGRPPGPPALRGDTCPDVVTKMFMQHHAQLKEYIGQFKVTSVRLEAEHGMAVLRFRSGALRQMPVVRQGKVWKIDSLLEGGFP